MEHAIYHPGPVDPSLLIRQGDHRSELIWDGQEKDFRLRTNFGSYWDVVRTDPPPPTIIEAITSAGLLGVFQIGMMIHDAGLITAFVERWRPETHTFHFSFGEATITLDDVYHILGLRVSGYPVFTDQGSPDASLVHELLGVHPNSVDEGGHAHMLTTHTGDGSWAEFPWPNPMVEAPGDVYLGPGWDGPHVSLSSHGDPFTATQVSESSHRPAFTGTPTYQGSHTSQSFPGYGFASFGATSVLGSQHHISIAEQSYFTYAGGSTFNTPPGGFQPFISHDTLSSMRTAPVGDEDDEDEEDEELVDEEIEVEEAPAVQLRKQPGRYVKGKERLCITGGPMCDHNNKKKKNGKGPR